VNKGLAGASTRDLTSVLTDTLAAVRPQIVITMMGVNDSHWYGAPAPRPAPGRLSAFVRSLRTYKLLRYVYHEVLGAGAPPSPASMESQDWIVRTVLEHKSALIMMQYPGLDSAPLRKHFGAIPGIVFVDNKEAFDRALAQGSYDDYFIDRFAGDWGHCTARGDQLLARNAAKAVRWLEERR